MQGSWRLQEHRSDGTARVPGHAAHRVRAILVFPDVTAVGEGLAVLDLVPTTEERRVIGHLGPDLCAEVFDDEAAAARLAAEGERRLLDALLDQRVVAGIGAWWAQELCFVVGSSPWSSVAGADASEALIHQARRLLRRALNTGVMCSTGDTRPSRRGFVYGRSGRPCRRCGTPIAFLDAIDERATSRRPVWWCPSCQPGPTAPAPARRPRLRSS